MRLTPGGPLPGGAPIRIVSGEYEGYVGTLSGHTTVDGKLTRYKVAIKRPEESEGVEFITDVPPDVVRLRR